jgi:hypothetical protein
MGTNYYWKPSAPGAETLHIGKSSVGWTFHFHAVEHQGLASWHAWRHRLERGDGQIVDEYGEPCPFLLFVGKVETLQRARRKDGTPFLNPATEVLEGRVNGVPPVILAHLRAEYFLDPEGYAFSRGKFS